MADTINRGYPLPDDAAHVNEVIRQLQQATLPMIDTDVGAILLALALKANVGHGHNVDDVTGLVQALAGKMAANRRFAVGELSDVEGASAAPDGYVLVKVGDRWVAQSISAAIGDHEHGMSAITGLEDALAGKLNTDRIWTGNQAAYDALPSKSATTLYFIT